jgi:hypothetical protein
LPDWVLTPDIEETAMKSVSCIAAAAALAGTLAGCADPGYPRYGYSQATYYPSQATYYPSGYSYRQPVTYYSNSYPPAYYSSSPAPYYGAAYSPSSWDYYRHYNGIHPGPEQTP